MEQSGLGYLCKSNQIKKIKRIKGNKKGEIERELNTRPYVPLSPKHIRTEAQTSNTKAGIADACG